jgi:hypothetical protein
MIVDITTEWRRGKSDWSRVLNGHALVVRRYDGGPKATHVRTYTVTVDGEPVPRLTALAVKTAQRRAERHVLGLQQDRQN